MKKKQRKSPTKKPVAKKSTAPRARKAAAAAPAAAAPQAKPITFPALVHVLKGGDAIAVTVTDQAHLARLQNEHGESSVKVQA